MSHRPLSLLAREILACLEEAGEDDYAALANTVGEGSPSRESLVVLNQELQRLVHDDLVLVAQSRDQTTLRWEFLDKEASLRVLADAPGRMTWSDDGRLWRWLTGHARVEVLLTESGQAAAARSLRGDSE